MNNYEGRCGQQPCRDGCPILVERRRVVVSSSPALDGQMGSGLEQDRICRRSCDPSNVVQNIALHVQPLNLRVQKRRP